MRSPNQPVRTRRLWALLALVTMQVMALTGTASPASARVPGLTFTQTGCEGFSDSVARLYAAGFGRQPDQEGFQFWMDEYTSGRWTFPAMAGFFVESTEFVSTYQELDNLAFVQQIYRNVLGREGDAEGIDFWTGQVNSGITRAAILMRFAESPENVTRTGTVEPQLGFYNNGLSAPWTCDGLPPLPPSACTILSRTAAGITVQVRISNLDTVDSVNATISILGQVNVQSPTGPENVPGEASEQVVPNIGPRQTVEVEFTVPFPITAAADPATSGCFFVTTNLEIV